MIPVNSAGSCSAILVAAGASRRMGMDKLAWRLAGVPVLRRSLEAFLAAEWVDSVVVVCPEERWEWLVDGGFCKPVVRVDGGKERQDSVALGLAALAADVGWVAVHDGARPLISPAEIDRCVVAARQHRAVALARRTTETMMRSDEQDFCVEPVDRENLWCMETPQIFEKRLLEQAYAAVRERGLHVTDEVSALQAIGVRVKLMESRQANLKITTPADLALAAALCENAKS